MIVLVEIIIIRILTIDKVTSAHLFTCSLHECWDTKKHTKHVFNAAINNRSYSVIIYIKLLQHCKLSVMNVHTDRLTDEIHVHHIYMGLV